MFIRRSGLILAVLVLAGCTTYSYNPNLGGFHGGGCCWGGGGWGHSNVFVANNHNFYHPGRNW